jgi:hypothetical protein
MLGTLAANRVKAHHGKSKDYNMLVLVGAMIALPSPILIDMAIRYAFELGPYTNLELATFLVGVCLAVTPAVIKMRKTIRDGGLNPNV